MYKNQKGQRNLSDLWSEKINGEIVKAEIKAEGAAVGHTYYGNQHSKSLLDQTDPVSSDKPKSTVARVAKEIGVPEGTLKKQLEFARGLDAAEEVEPGFQQEVLNGDVKASRASVRKLRLMDPEERKDAINTIRNPPPKPHKPKAPADPEAAAKRAEARKKSVTNERGVNQYTKEVEDPSDPQPKPHSTAEAIAREKAFRFTDALLSFSEFSEK